MLSPHDPRLRNHAPLHTATNGTIYVKTNSFNESGYELDHVVPFSESCLTVNQLQPLCPQCHAKKTRIWRASQSEEEAL